MYINSNNVQFKIKDINIVEKGTFKTLLGTNSYINNLYHYSEDGV